MSNPINADTILTSIATEVAKTISEGLTAAGIRCVDAHAGSSVYQHPNLVRSFSVREVGEQPTLDQDPQMFAATWGLHLTAEILSELKQAHPDGNGIVFSDFPRPPFGVTARGSYDKVKVLAGVKYQQSEHVYVYDLGVQLSSFKTQIPSI